MKLKVCKGCKGAIIRKRLNNGKLEQLGNYLKKVYHDKDCLLMRSTRRRAEHYARY